jgi:tetratricopeptide (TPR) repeat protein
MAYRSPAQPAGDRPHRQKSPPGTATGPGRPRPGAASPGLRAVGDRQGRADTCDSLGYIHHQLGDHRRAIACFEQALDLFTATGDRYSEASTLGHLGDSHHAAGDPDTARTAWRGALTILRQLGHPDAERVRNLARYAVNRPGPHPRSATGPQSADSTSSANAASIARSSGAIASGTGTRST